MYAADAVVHAVHGRQCLVALLLAFGGVFVDVVVIFACCCFWHYLVGDATCCSAFIIS